MRHPRISWQDIGVETWAQRHGFCWVSFNMMERMFPKILLLMVLATSFSRADVGDKSDFEFSMPQHQGVAIEEFKREYGEVLNQSQFLLVGGFGNEMARPYYLTDNVKALNRMGVTTVNKFFPSSFHSVVWNTKVIYEEIIRRHQETPGKPLVLIGHSKGGLEVLATVLEYPELVLDGIVKEVILIQAPLGGNTMADKQGPFNKLFLAAALSMTAYGSLQTPDINEVISKKIEGMDRETRGALSGVVKYITSSKPPKDMGGFLRTIAVRFNPRVSFDGLVATQDMSLPDFGSVIGDLKDFDHLETTLQLKLPLIGNLVPNRIVEFMVGLASHLIPNHPIHKRREIRQSRERRENRENRETGVHVLPRKSRSEPALIPNKMLRCLELL
ncbi:MAG: hypothetical protein IPK04_16160 [Bdellovibrionales bacterium]|nr:hypothetical protein [Bdellovibrionales bacterium]